MDPPSLLGSLQSINNPDSPLRHLKPALDTLAAVICLLEQLMTAPAPNPAPFPSSCLVSALVRLIKFDQGSVLSSGRVPPSTSMFTELCGSMSSIRATAWRLLSLLVGLCGPSLCPLHPSLGRLMGESLRRLRARGSGALSAVGVMERQNLYRAVADLVHAGGIAVGRQLASEALLVSMIEFYGSAAPEPQVDNRTKIEARASKKSKHHSLDAAIVSPQGSESSPPAFFRLDEVSAQGAMFNLLEALLESCGPLMQASVRAHFDALSIHIASCCSDSAIASTRDTNSISEHHAAALDILRIHSLQLLLASLTVPAGHRPPYLSQVRLVMMLLH